MIYKKGVYSMPQIAETQHIDDAIAKAEEEYETTGILFDAEDTLASLRRKHLPNKLVQTVTTEVLREVINLLQDDIYKMVLYGSYARGDFDSESDIDILIVLNSDMDKVRKYRKQVSHVASRVGLKNDVEVSLLLRDRETVEKGMQILPFYKNIMTEGVEIYG
jgi:predicted nucleotidyltransferase